MVPILNLKQTNVCDFSEMGYQITIQKWNKRKNSENIKIVLKPKNLILICLRKIQHSFGHLDSVKWITLNFVCVQLFENNQYKTLKTKNWAPQFERKMSQNASK